MCRSAKCFKCAIREKFFTQTNERKNKMQRIAYNHDASKLSCLCVWLVAPPIAVSSGHCAHGVSVWVCSCASLYVYLFLSFATERQKFRHQHQTWRLRSESTRSHFIEFIFRFRKIYETKRNTQSHLTRSHVDQIFTRCPGCDVWCIDAYT